MSMIRWVFRNLLPLDPKLSLSLFENREVCNITQGNLTIYFGCLLDLFNYKTQCIFGKGSIVIVCFPDRLICCRRNFLIDLLPLYQKLNGSLPFCPNIPVRLNPCLDDAFYLIRPLLNTFLSGIRPASGHIKSS